MNLPETLEASAKAANLQEKHYATLQLARIYAIRLDIAVIKGDDKTIQTIGPKFLDALDALGMTLATKAAKDEVGGAANNEQQDAANAFAALRNQWN